MDVVKEGKPAWDNVELCDWIVRFDEKSTTGLGTGELVRLIKNAGEDIELVIRRPKHHTKDLYWRENKELEISSENFNLVRIEHLYLTVSVHVTYIL